MKYWFKYWFIRSLHHIIKKFWIEKAILVNTKWSIHTDNLVSFGSSILIFCDMRFCTFRSCDYWKEMFFWWVHSLFLLLKRFSSKTELKTILTKSKSRVIWNWRIQKFSKWFLNSSTNQKAHFRKSTLVEFKAQGTNFDSMILALFRWVSPTHLIRFWLVRMNHSFESSKIILNSSISYHTTHVTREINIYWYERFLVLF